MNASANGKADFARHVGVVAAIGGGGAPWAMWTPIVGTFAVSALALVLIDHPVDRWRRRRAAGANPSARTQAAADAGATSISGRSGM